MGIKTMKLNRPIFITSVESMADFVYKMKDEDYRQSVKGCDILLDGYIKANNSLEKDFLVLTRGSDTLGINFIIVSDIDRTTDKPEIVTKSSGLKLILGRGIERSREWESFMTG